jgi:hypothetical protein
MHRPPAPRRTNSKPRIESLEARLLLDASNNVGAYPLANPGPYNSLNVRFANSSPQAAQAALNPLGAYVANVKRGGTCVVVLGQGVDPTAAVQELSQDPNVASVSVNRAATSTATPTPIPAAVPFGTGIEGNTPYSNDMMWVDVRNLFSAWSPLNNPNGTVPLTADGYPLANATTLTNLKGYPDGIYHLSFTGSATVTVGGMGQLVSPITTSANGISTAQVQITHAKANVLTLRVTNIDPHNPLDNLHLIAPGYDPTNPPIFTNEFLQRLQPFSVIRFMGWMKIDTSSIQNWSDVPTPNDFLQTGPNGAAYEYMVALANAVHKDIWINIPDQATGDFIKHLADLLRDQLDPGLNVYVEYSNELWNTAYPQFHRNLAAAQANPVLTATGPTARAAQEAAYRLMQVANIFRQEFGDQADRVRPVFGGQFTNPFWLKQGLQFINANFGPPSNYFYGVAVAPYIILDPKVDVPGLTMNQLFASLNSYLNTTMVPDIAANAALAQQFGLQLVSYEGGQALQAWNPKLQANVNDGLKLAAQNDPRMDQLYHTLITAWRQNGGGLFDFSALSFGDDQWGSWGLLNGAQEAGSQKWDAVLSMTEQPGDADLDGSVGYDDFLIVEQNYGRSGTWWQQGNFNHDKSVDKADVQTLLYNLNLSTLTASQLANVKSFAQSIGITQV